VFGWQDAGDLAQNGPLIPNARDTNVAVAASVKDVDLFSVDNTRSVN